MVRRVKSSLNSIIKTIIHSSLMAKQLMQKRSCKNVSRCQCEGESLYVNNMNI